MCRMFGIAAEAPSSLHEVLVASSRSLRVLSREHADGWGIARHDGETWAIERDTSCAAASDRYAQLAERTARLAIAHVRKKTVGATALTNTHPFTRDGFVFAHNGTVTRIAEIAALAAPEYLAEVAGETDSERLFAFVRTQIADATTIELGLQAAVRILRRLGDIGTASFLFSCGARLYAYRSGPTLFSLVRGGATMIASEPLDDDAWREIPDGTLERVAIEQPSMIARAA